MKYMLAIFALTLPGCGLVRKAFRVNPYSAPSAPVHEQTTAEKLDLQLGIMTYEVALQWFGPPMQCAEAGKTKTCIWTAGPDGMISSTSGSTYGNRYGAGYDGSTSTQIREGPRATLAFTNDKLVNWRLTGNWK